MLFPVEQAFVGRNEKRAPLKTPVWEARVGSTLIDSDQLASNKKIKIK